MTEMGNWLTSTINLPKWATFRATSQFFPSKQTRTPSKYTSENPANPATCNDKYGELTYYLSKIQHEHGNDRNGELTYQYHKSPETTPRDAVELSEGAQRFPDTKSSRELTAWRLLRLSATRREAEQEIAFSQCLRVSSATVQELVNEVATEPLPSIHVRDNRLDK